MAPHFYYQLLLRVVLLLSPHLPSNVLMNYEQCVLEELIRSNAASIELATK